MVDHSEIERSVSAEDDARLAAVEAMLSAEGTGRGMGGMGGIVVSNLDMLDLPLEQRFRLSTLSPKPIENGSSARKLQRPADLTRQRRSADPLRRCALIASTFRKISALTSSISGSRARQL